jgi:hypothetical protein
LILITFPSALAHSPGVAIGITQKQVIILDNSIFMARMKGRDRSNRNEDLLECWALNLKPENEEDGQVTSAILFAYGRKLGSISDLGEVVFKVGASSRIDDTDQQPSLPVSHKKSM